MKIKLFYQNYGQSLEEFEHQVNEFMAGVEVVGVRHTEIPYGSYENMDTVTSILVLYRDND